MVKKTTFADFGFQDPPQPYWLVSTRSTVYPALENDIKVDVAVVGGGITGLTAAYLLKREGVRVAVIEADRIVQGATGHTTAKITSQHGLVYSKLIKHLGLEKARQYAEANESAITFIEKLVQEKGINCDFSQQAAYVYTQSDKYIRQLEDEAAAADSLGIKAAYLEKLPLPFTIKAAVRFDNQAQFHPRKYLLALAKEIHGNGSHIFEHTRAVKFHEGSPCVVVSANGRRVSAEQVIIATHYPACDGSGFYFARLSPERSYALGVRIKEKYPGGMYITAEQPGRSLRFTPFDGGQLVIAAGEHHKTGHGPNTNTHYHNLAVFMRETFDVLEMPFRWSTQDYSSMDDIPYTGRLTTGSTGIYVATGFRKWGMTNGTASAILLKDLIVKGESPWAPVYNPSRFEADPMFKNLLKTNFAVARRLVGDKLKKVPKNLELKPGEAGIINQDGDKVGLYKDEKGKMHAVDITCPHMGCELSWNAAELTWDCPCHGSRFTYTGEIVEGPALKALRTASVNLHPLP